MLIARSILGTLVPSRQLELEAPLPPPRIMALFAELSWYHQSRFELTILYIFRFHFHLLKVILWTNSRVASAHDGATLLQHQQDTTKLNHAQHPTS